MVGDYEDQRVRHCLPIDGSGRWATEDGAFAAWEKAENLGLLWLTADPACGKSVLANGYAKKLEEERPVVLACSYFFRQNGAHQALSAILHQIPHQIPCVRLLHTRRIRRQWPFVYFQHEDVVKDGP